MENKIAHDRWQECAFWLEAQKTEVWTHWSEPSLAAYQIKQEVIKDGVSSPRRKQNRETGYAEGALNLYEIKMRTHMSISSNTWHAYS